MNHPPSLCEVGTSGSLASTPAHADTAASRTGFGSRRIPNNHTTEQGYATGGGCYVPRPAVLTPCWTARYQQGKMGTRHYARLRCIGS